MANSIARMQGSTPETLTPGNCANPRFKGSLGEGAVSPADPLANVASLGNGGTGGGTGGTEGGGSGGGGAAGGTDGTGGSGGAATGPAGTSTGGAAGTSGPAPNGSSAGAGVQAAALRSVGPAEQRRLGGGQCDMAAGRSRWRTTAPWSPPTGIWLLLLLLVLIASPLLFVVLRKL